MEVNYTSKAQSDISFWKKSGNKKVQQKISQLIEAILVNSFQGIGKPEQLKHELSGKWSRRIDRENRIIYSVVKEDNSVLVYSLRGHYSF